VNRIALSRRGRGARLAEGSCRLLHARLGRALLAAGLDGVELSLTLSDDDELRALNAEYAGEDHATDVLSFEQGGIAPPGGRRALGDVIISVEYAARQAQRGLAAELFHLAVHGLVHLCGYDHSDAAEERVMFGYEAALRGAALARGPVRRVSAPPRGRARSAPARQGRPPRPAARGTGARPRPRARRRRARR
jgi:probable rRNA maturation factor